MTDDEYRAVCRAMEDLFQGDFPQTKRDRYRMFLGRFTTEEVLAALAALVERGVRFLPVPGEIVPEIRKLTDVPVPGWGEIWPALQKAMNVSARRGSGDKTASGAVWLEANCHPVAARFYELETYEKLSQIPFFDPDYGHFRVAELKDRWEEFVNVAEARLHQGRALELAGARRGGLPRSLDEAAILTSLRPEPAGALPAGEQGSSDEGGTITP